VLSLDLALGHELVHQLRVALSKEIGTLGGGGQSQQEGAELHEEEEEEEREGGAGEA
jgi:hypothetical protein